MSRICVIGVGYVGLVTGACLADLGNQVVCLNRNQAKADNLKQGILPIYEPGLEEIVQRNLAAERLTFTTSYDEAMNDCDLVFVAVGTPSGVNGEADLAYVEAAVTEVAHRTSQPITIINKSTVPIGTGDWVADLMRAEMPDPTIPVRVGGLSRYFPSASPVKRKLTNLYSTRRTMELKLIVDLVTEGLE